MISYAKSLMLQGDVKQISRKMFQVKEHIVKFQTKKGRVMITCDCKNASYFSHNQFCVHKAAAIIFASQMDFLKRLDKLIEQYEGFEKNKLPNVSNYCFLNDLKEMRRKF